MAAVDAWERRFELDESSAVVRYTRIPIPPEFQATRRCSTDRPASPVLRRSVCPVVVTINYSVSDGTVSGVKSASATLDGATVTQGQTITLFNYTLGTPHILTVTASDNVTNTSATKVVFTIIVTPQSIENDVKLFLANGAITSKSVASILLDSLLEAAAARANGDCVARARAVSARPPS